MKKVMKAWMIILLAVFLFLSGPLSIFVQASDFSAWSVDGVTLSDDNGITWTVNSSGNGVDGTAKGNAYYYDWNSWSGVNSTPSSGTLTITCDKAGTIKFNYSYSLIGGTGSNTSTIAGLFSNSATGSERSVSSEVYVSDVYTAPVVAGEQLTFTLTGSAGRNSSSSNTTGTVSLNITNLEFIPETTVDVTFKAIKNGSYTVKGSAITADTSFNVSNTTSFTVVPTANDGYAFAGWQRTNAETNAVDYLTADANGVIFPTVSCSITPIFVPDDNGTAPFLVGSTSYWTWETAIVAAQAAASKTVILSDNYTLPGAADADVLDRNALTTAGGTHVKFTTSDGKITGVTYQVPADVTFLIPYDDAHTGLKDSVYPQIVNGVGSTLKSSDKSSTYAKGTLTVPANTTIASMGTFIVNGQQLATDQRDTGSACGPHGLLKLTESTSKLNIQSGSLYCYGYITGNGKVEVASGAEAYELLQLLDWRGFTATLSWMGTNLDTNNLSLGLIRNLVDTLVNTATMQQTNRSFIFSQYYVQNIEADLQLNVGATLNGALAMNTKEETPQYIIPFVITGDGENGFLKLSGTGSLLREYESSTDRVTYTVGCDVTTGNIQVTFGTKLLGIDLSATLNSRYNIFPLNSNISINVQSGKTLTIATDMKLMPESSVNVQSGGNLVIADGTEFFVYDKADWLAGGYAYGADLHQVHYVASRGGAPAARTIDESSKLNVNGTLTINSTANLFTTSGYVRNGANAVGDAKNADKVITGTGKIINNSTTTEGVGELDEFEFSGAFTVAHEITTVPFVGKLSGVTAGDSTNPYDSFGTGTYYGLGADKENYWYQYVVNKNLADVAVTVTSDKQTAGTAVTHQDNKDIANIIGYVANSITDNGILTFTVPSCYTVAANGETLTPTDGVYTLTGLNANTTLNLTENHTEGAPVVENKVDATFDAPGSYDSVVYCSVCKAELSRQTMVIPQKTSVAMIDNTRYESLQAALDAVLEGDTIVLLAAPEDGVVFNKCVTIDTNGITYNIKCAEGWEAIDKGDGIYLVGNTSLFDIYASSIRAGDSLDLYFYIDPDDLEGSSKSEFKASITRYYAGGSPKTTTVDGSQWTYSDGYYRFSYNGIAAKEMTDKIFVTIYKGDTQVSNVRMETVENYALRVLNKQVKDADANSKDAALRTTLVDMLNYGAACQTYFDGYAADNPANAQIDDFQQYATQSVTYDNTQTGDKDIYGSSVSAESKLVYTFYYTFNPSDRNLTAYVTYEDHYGKNVELTIRSFREKQGYYGVDVEGLAVADGRQTITCQLKDENGEVTHTASGNVESYVAVAVANAGEDKDVFLSLLKFVDSARAYFHSGEET